MAKLEVCNLKISFRTNNGAVRAVRDISFDLGEGETLAIVGESGSGKSVTARAVMGILAGNAMVENGQIIYDGKDLLKISEDDFHTLRGHKLAMIFQDPLSALNPIMRIGKQLTEAMILNNRERRRDGRQRFNQTLKLLEGRITEALIQEGADASVKERTALKVKAFDSFVAEGVKLQMAYDAARESVVEAEDCLEEMNIAAVKGEGKALREIAARLEKAARRVYNAYVVPKGDAEFEAGLQAVLESAKRFAPGGAEAVKGRIAQLSVICKAARSKAEPNFFCIGYAVSHGAPADPLKESVEEINRRSREKLDREFMLDFLEDVKKALRYSHDRSLKEKEQAIAALDAALPAFLKSELDKAELKAAARKAAHEVEDVIDRLELKKDSLSYIFRTSLNAAIERYFYGLAFNPREKRRFEKETIKRNALVKRGKAAPTVVPMNLVDVEAAHENMIKTVRDLTDLFKRQMASQAEPDYDTLALEMIDYLKARASDYAYKLSTGMANHRAMELMNEVGIPEPHKRFHQYPFEFSGGMRQRIVIAIALSANPDILICDEPTTALDVTIQAQILELINKLKAQRKLSVIFITHDLGVVANMADRIAVMYAGKIVEYGTADDVFYQPAHPYTWALLSSMPDLETREKLEAIPGTPPNMILPPKGDAFAARNHYAMQIDFEQEPPMFRISGTHSAGTWLLHPGAPKVEPPAIVRERIDRMRRRQAQEAEGKGGEPA